MSVLDLLSSFLSLFLHHDTPKAEALRLVNWSTWFNSMAVQSWADPDPAAQVLVQQHLNGMAALGAPVDRQGVWVQVGNHVVAEHVGYTPLPAASLTKVATTLVALATWGADHQFETRVNATGPIVDGVLQGDLVIQGGGDPFFVWEESFVLGNALNQLGIQRVTGNLIITGNFAMNYETNPITAGNLLKQGIDADRWSAEASAQYGQLTFGTPRPQVKIDGTVQAMALPDVAGRITKPLLSHKSLPLVSILKAMNIYSNNIMSEMVANSLGGAAAVAQKAAKLAYVPQEEIQLVNGSGLGEDNRISPRAVAAMLTASQQLLQVDQLNLGNIYPVIGRDGGTLKGRTTPPGSVAKTGTLDAVSSYAGVMPTRDRGLVWFAIINYGTGELNDYHRQQDALLQQLQQLWGAPTAIPTAILPSDRTNSEFHQVGAPSRNQPL